jgi:CubicO group peptidase (beta-lactamase class C family)
VARRLQQWLNPVTRLTRDGAITGVQDVLREAAAADRFSGTVLVEKDGQVLFSRAYGLADRERGITNTLQTRFRVGSMNKMFTGVAVVQLIEAGEVELTAPVGEYLGRRWCGRWSWLGLSSLSGGIGITRNGARSRI